MAVKINGSALFGQGQRGDISLIWGTVALDGSNPTNVDLSGYLKADTENPIQAIISLDGATAPGLDPTLVTSTVAAAMINIYAWKVAAADNGNLIASTDNTRLVNWIALGPRR